MQQVFIGTSGYQYKDWKERFYPNGLPQREWLSYYATQFPTVEINATFYGSFTYETYAKWASLTPPDFRFAIKGSRYITHIKRLKNLTNEVDRFFEHCFGLGEKLAVVLWQFPASFIRDAKNETALSDFLEMLPENIRYAFEFRHASWFIKDIFDIANANNATLVINDTAAFPVIDHPAGRFAYIRFHGPTSLYSSSYSDAELANWAGRIAAFRQRRVYCYFNNDVSGYAVRNAKTLEKFLGRRGQRTISY